MLLTEFLVLVVAVAYFEPLSRAVRPTLILWSVSMLLPWVRVAIGDPPDSGLDVMVWLMALSWVAEALGWCWLAYVALRADGAIRLGMFKLAAAANPTESDVDMALRFPKRERVRVVGSFGADSLQIGLRYGEITVANHLVPDSLRKPNTEFVAVLLGREFLRVEEHGHEWLAIQDSMRVVLNRDWDPIGVSKHVDDEYDSYIDGLYPLLYLAEPLAALNAHLKWIEVKRMGNDGEGEEARHTTARSLVALDLPIVPLR